MRRHLPCSSLKLLATGLALLTTGCPLSDDYFLVGETGGSDSSGGFLGAGDGGASPTGGRGGTGGSAQTTGGSGGSGNIRCSTLTRDRARYSFCSTLLSFPEASVACVANGMSLAAIQSRHENDWIAQNLRSTVGASLVRAFVGGSDAETEGIWKWIDGAVFWRGGVDGEPEDGSYVPWDTLQPNNYSPVSFGPENCLTINIADGTWNDMRCELELPFVCKGR